MPPASHVHGIRLDHVHVLERAVRVNRVGVAEGPITWGGVTRIAGIRQLEIGSARLHEHALALAAMWERSVLSGHIDMS